MTSLFADPRRHRQLTPPHLTPLVALPLKDPQGLPYRRRVAPPVLSAFHSKTPTTRPAFVEPERVPEPTDARTTRLVLSMLLPTSGLARSEDAAVRPPAAGPATGSWTHPALAQALRQMTNYELVIRRLVANVFCVLVLHLGRRACAHAAVQLALESVAVFVRLHTSRLKLPVYVDPMGLFPTAALWVYRAVVLLLVYNIAVSGWTLVQRGMALLAPAAGPTPHQRELLGLQADVLVAGWTDVKPPQYPDVAALMSDQEPTWVVPKRQASVRGSPSLMLRGRVERKGAAAREVAHRAAPVLAPVLAPVPSTHEPAPVSADRTRFARRFNLGLE